MVEQEEKSRAFRLDNSTLIPVGISILGITTAVSIAMWLQSSILELKYKEEMTSSSLRAGMATLQDSVTALSAKLDESMHDRWTFGDMQNWVKLLASENKALLIPAPTRNR